MSRTNQTRVDNALNRGFSFFCHAQALCVKVSWKLGCTSLGNRNNRSLDCDVASNCLITEKKAHRAVKDTEI